MLLVSPFWIGALFFGAAIGAAIRINQRRRRAAAIAAAAPKRSPRARRRSGSRRRRWRQPRRLGVVRAPSERSAVRRQQHEIEAAAARVLLERLIGPLDEQHERGARGRAGLAETLLRLLEVVRHRVRHRLVVLERRVAAAGPRRRPGSDRDDREPGAAFLGQLTGVIDRRPRRRGCARTGPGPSQAISRITRQGLPKQRWRAGMSLVTTLPAPTTVSAPIAHARARRSRRWRATRRLRS